MFCLDGQCVGSCLRETAYLCVGILTVGGGEYMGCCGYDCSVLKVSDVLAKDYNNLLGARIMQGFGTGPFEMLVPSSIGDMYVGSPFHG